jgi:hypothetical protein
MNSPTFQCPIQMQPKLAVFGPAVFLVIMIVGGWALYALGKRGVISQGLSGGLGTVLFFVAVIGIVVVIVAGKGRIEVTGQEVVLRRGLSGTVTVPRTDARYALTRWRSYVHFAAWLEAGPQLKFTGGGRSVTIACLGPELARDLPGGGTYVPDAVVAPGDFQQLLDALGIARPSGAPGR